MLSDINIANKICDIDEEIDKLARIFSFQGGDVINCLAELFFTPMFDDVNEIRRLLLEVIEPGHILLRYDSRNATISEHIIKTYAENYFFNAAYTDEVDAYELTQRRISVEWNRPTKSPRPVKNVVSMLCRDLNAEDSKKMIAYILLMLDEGLATIYSIVPDRAKDDDLFDGFCQYLKAGEQGLLVYPLRMYRFMPLMAEINRNCIYNVREFDDEFMEFVENGNSSLTKEDVEEILHYVDVLDDMGQTPLDWDGDYHLHFEEYDSDNESGTEELWMIYDDMRKYRKEYQLYSSQPAR